VLHPHTLRRSLTAGSIAMSIALLVVTVALRAEQAPAQGAARPLVPMTASSLLRDPASHMGENVSLMAAVETILSKTAFTVDQDKAKATGKELLVLVPTLTTPPEPNLYVTVQGEVMKFDVAEIAKKARGYTIDLTPEQIAKYTGQPMVLAAVVVTPALVDLAKRPIRPMTPEEITFATWMNAMNPAFTGLRAGLEQPNVALLKEQAATIKKSFVSVEAFFKAKGIADATKWAADAVAIATTIEVGLATGKFDEVKAAAGNLQPLCASCHTPYRERMDDGTYRIKIGG
jgi:cytochrome c556